MLVTSHFLRCSRYIHLRPIYSYTAALRNTLAYLPCWKFNAVFTPSYDVSNLHWRDI